MNDTNSNWELVTLTLTHARAVLLHGRPGTGKTYAAARCGLRQGQSVYSITLTPETPAAELRGHYIPGADGKFVWHDGPAIRAWREGARLILNEIDLAGGDLQGLLYAITDSPDSARLTLPTGETVQPAPGFSLVATTNAKPGELPEGLQSRFPVSIEILDAHPEALQSLPEDLRKAAQSTIAHADPEQRLSIRAWLAFGELREKIGAPDAAAAVFGGRSATVLQSITIGAV